MFSASTQAQFTVPGLKQQKFFNDHSQDRPLAQALHAHHVVRVAPSNPKITLKKKKSLSKIMYCLKGEGT